MQIVINTVYPNLNKIQAVMKHYLVSNAFFKRKDIVGPATIRVVYSKKKNHAKQKHVPLIRKKEYKSDEFLIECANLVVKNFYPDLIVNDISVEEILPTRIQVFKIIIKGKNVCTV